MTRTDANTTNHRPALDWLRGTVIAPGHPVDHGQALLAYHPDAPNSAGLIVRMRLLGENAQQIDAKTFTRPVALGGLLLPGVLGYPVPWTLGAGQAVVAEAFLPPLTPDNPIAIARCGVADAAERREIVVGVKSLRDLPDVRDARVVIDLDGAQVTDREIGSIPARELVLRHGEVRVQSAWLSGKRGQRFEAHGVNFLADSELALRPVAKAYAAEFFGCAATGFVDAFRDANRVVSCIASGSRADAFSDNALTVACMSDRLGGFGDGRHGDGFQQYSATVGHRVEQRIVDTVALRDTRGQCFIQRNVSIDRLVLRGISCDARTSVAGGESTGRLSHLMAPNGWTLIENLAMPGSTVNIGVDDPPGIGRFVMRDSTVWGVNGRRGESGDHSDIKPGWIRNVLELRHHAPGAPGAPGRGAA